MANSGKVAIVTGSATGLGATCAIDLAAKGWNVAVNYTKSRKEAEATHAAVTGKGVEAILVQANMGEDADCRRLAAETMKKWGRIDGLINNAGTTKFQAPGDLDGVTPEDFDRIFRINVTGPYMMSRAVFPAMTLRRDFSDADLGYLANLCHGCRGCFYACQYAPPHEFGINLPQQFAEVRAETYEEYAWPASLGRLFHRNGVVVSTVTAAAVALVLILTMALQSGENLFAARPVVPGTFYQVIPFGLMATLGTVTFLFSLVAIFMGARNFWLDAGGVNASNIPSWSEAISDALTLKHLGGGGDGCNDVGERFSQARRHLHHTLFYGFGLCFVATTLGFFYHHLFGWVAPYGFFRAPVLLGTLGGIGMMVGSVGLFWLKVIGDREPTAPKLLGGEVALLFLLFAVAFTGMLLLAFRTTGAMGILLAVHLGFVLAFFLALPYSRMVHGPYRLAALLRCALDRRTREPVG